MQGAARSATAWALVALMAVGSVVLWIGVPLFWLWLASRLAESSQPSLGLYTMIIVGIPATMVLIGKLLGHANRMHMQLTGTVDHRPQQAPWLKSLRGERVTRRNHGALGTIMVVSVVIALTCMGIWFFFFAEGGGLPG